MARWHYTKEELIQALRTAGIQQGDALYMHISPLALGFSQEVMKGQNMLEFFHECIFTVIGKEGTLITPTYSYSFCKYEVYDLTTSPCRVGTFGEWFRQLPNVHRSDDPIFSLAAQGPLTQQLFENLPNTCFGQDCVYERMAKNGVKICNIGLSLHYTTALYHLQWLYGTPYRFDKLFTGMRQNQDGSLHKESWVYYVRTLVDESFPDFQPMHDLAIKRDVAHLVHVGSSFIVTTDLHDFYTLCEREFKKNPWCVTPNPEGCDIIAKDKERTGVQHFTVTRPKSLSAKDIIASVWNLPRDIVSDGYDAAVQTLAALQPMIIHEYRTGDSAFSWIIPERWLCRSARLETLDGTVLYSTEYNPLCCMRYSLSFDGEVSREELFKHLYSNEKKADLVPYIFKYYERNWGLCIPDSLKKTLTEKKYRVVIDTDFSMSTLKVGEVVLEGEIDEHIVLCAHLCHPYQVSDGLSGVAVGMEVMERLRQLKTRRYTYHLLILPETIGSAAWCSRNEKLLPKIKGGIFLEMLSSKGKLVYKNSAQEESFFDKLVGYILKTEFSAAHLACYAPPLNDERMFNAVGVPMMSLFRQEEGEIMFANYHTSDDNFLNCDEEKLKESSRAVYECIIAFEKNYIPVPLYKGELFCSKVNGLDYSLHCNAIIKTTFFMNGYNSIFDIAQKGNSCFKQIFYLCEHLYKKHLINKK